jgi:uncharacterized membrane protein
VDLYLLQAMMGALMFGIGAMFFKWNAHNLGDDNYFFAGLYSAGGVCFFIEGFDQLSTFSGIEYYISGALIALGAAGGNYFFSQGLRHGPAGLTSAFAKANIIIVILMSALYYGEALNLLETLGILSILVAMLVVNLKFGTSVRPTSKLWFMLMLCSMTLLAFRNGGLKVVNEIGLNSALVMALAYFICTVIFGLGILKNRNKTWTARNSKSKVIIIGWITGISSYVGLYFYITALKTGPASIVVTIFSLDMIFVLLMSYLIFKERLNKNQMIGFTLSAMGFILLSMG